MIHTDKWKVPDTYCVTLTDKHNCADLIYWSFFQYYKFRLFTSAIIVG